MAVAMVIYPIFASLDLRRHIVPPDRVRDAGPEKDAIPDVLERRFITAAAATFLDSNAKMIGPPERSALKTPVPFFLGRRDLRGTKDLRVNIDCFSPAAASLIMWARIPFLR